MARASRARNGRLAGGIVFALLLVLQGVGLAGCASGAAMGCSPCAEPVACTPCGPKTAPPPCERPPQAKAGEAWCQVWVPPVTGVEMTTICVKPACTQQVWIPPKYGMRPKLVCCAEPEMREKIVPAVWGVKQREVMVCPPKEEWKRICCPPTDLGPCEQQAECYTKVVSPAVYECEECPVCLAPERRCVTYKPAEFKVIEERYEISPGHCETITVPAEYKQCTKEVCVKPGYWEWRRNEACEVPVVMPMPAPCAPPPAALTALQVEMEDKAATGEAAGVFAVGDVVRYDLRIVSDEGSKALDGLKVVFSLPAELEFVSGGGQGLEVMGSGQSAQSASFDLPLGSEVALHVLCRVTAVPETNLTQLSASVQDAEGNELAVESESTTLKP